MLTIVKYRPFIAIYYLSHQHTAAKSLPSLVKCLIRKSKATERGDYLQGLAENGAACQ